jgi:transposase InsO family protein
MGIRSIARKRNPFRRKDEHMVYPNLLTDRTATRPFEKVCTDTTLLKHRGKGYDWNLYLDVFNNEIVGSDVRLSKSGHGAKNHFMALSRFLELRHQRGFDDQPTIVHSDQGAIYSSMAFHDRLPSNVIQSMSRAATPTDNPVMEAINGWIKDDLRYEFHLESAKDIHALIRRYIDYYNKVRLGYALQYKSPIQYRTELDYR